MLSILLSAALGAYLSRRIVAWSTSGEATIAFSAGNIASDLQWLFATFAATCLWVIAAARRTRTFLDTVVRPWFALVGLNLPELPTLPTLVLPATQTGAIAQPVKRQAA